MKRFLALLVTVLLLVPQLAMAGTLSGKNEFPLSDEVEELTIWTAIGSSVEDIEKGNMLTEYVEDWCGIKIHWVLCSWEEASTKFNLSLAGGDYPDIYCTPLTTDQILLNADEVFIPLNDLIDEYAYWLPKIFERDPSLKASITAPNGNIYSLFYSDVGVHMLSQHKLFVNTDWLNAYGKTPQTTEEFREMLQYFKDNDMNGNGQADDEFPFIGSIDGWNTDPLGYVMDSFQMFTDDYLVKDGDQLICCATTDGWRNGLKYMNSLYKDGLLAEETYVQNNSQLMSLVNKTDATEVMTGAVPGAFQGSFVDMSVIPFTAYTPLAPLEGPDGTRVAPSRSDSETAVISLRCAITTACKNPGLAMKFLDSALNYEDYNSNAYTYGFEGVNFDLDTENPGINGVLPSRKLRTDIPAVQNYTWNNQTMPYYDTEESRYAETSIPGSFGDSLYQAHKVYEPYYKYTGIPLVSWANNPELSEESIELSTLIEDHIKTSASQFVLGIKDVNDDAAWAAYLKELDDMGLARYLEIKTEILFGE